MALFNYATREITAKLVYYGPGVCGKTTSLQYIHERISPSQRGRLLSLATETDRTIFFDLLPLKLGEVGGFKLRFQLYTVPGQVKYNKTRKLVLQGADAVVFVADSQKSRREANIVSYTNLQENLREQNRDLADLPLVYEFNKRDMENILSIEELNSDVNPKNLPFFPTVAVQGVGVMEALESISKTALEDMERRLTSSQSPEPEEDDDDELLRMMEEDSMDDLSVGGGEELSFSTDDMPSLDSDTEQSSEDGLESKPIGYDDGIQIEELEIHDDELAHTGTLKESEFFNLQNIEDQALKELDDFLDGSELDDESLNLSGLDGDDALAGLSFDEDAGGDDDLGGLSFDEDAGGGDDLGGLSFDEDAGGDDDLGGLSFDEEPGGDDDLGGLSFDEELGGDDDLGGLSFDEEPGGDDDLGGLLFDEDASGGEPALLFDTEEEASEPESFSIDDTALDFSMDSGALGNEKNAEESFSLDENLGEDALMFDLESPDASEEVMGQPEFLPDEEELKGFTLEEDESLTFDQDGEMSPGDGGIEHLDILDSDLDLSSEEDGAEEELPAFSLEEAEEDADAGVDVSQFALDEEELSSFDMGEDSAALEDDLESLHLGETATKDWASEGLLQTGEDGGEQFDFSITDSVRFEMQVGEDMSSVTPFEQQLEDFSEEAFTAEKESEEEVFEPEISAEFPEEEEFQTISDEWTRLMVLAKFFYHQGETYRAQHTTGENILAILMYYTSAETALKAVAAKHETCNPTIAAFHLMLESVEEETEKPVAGAQSLLNNIVMLKNKIQLQSSYPDDEECELAARICQRFLGTLADDFLTIDFEKLSPILARPEGE